MVTLGIEPNYSGNNFGKHDQKMKLIQSFSHPQQLDPR